MSNTPLIQRYLKRVALNDTTFAAPQKRRLAMSEANPNAVIVKFGQRFAQPNPHDPAEIAPTEGKLSFATTGFRPAAARSSPGGTPSRISSLPRAAIIAA